MKETSPFHQQVPEGPATRVQVLRTYAPAEDCSDLQADSSPNSSSSGVVLITRVGSICRSTTSLVTTHLLTSRRLGSSNMMFIKVSSIMERNPRAPVSRITALSAMASNAPVGKRGPLHHRRRTCGTAWPTRSLVG